MNHASIRSMLLLVAGACGSLGAQDAFIRADSNIDADVDIADGVKTLEVLFLGRPNPGCDDAMDSNDNGALDIADAVFTLNFLFSGGGTPPPPYPGCGDDPTGDELGCGAFAECEQTPCFDEAFLDATIDEEVPPVACVAPDSARLTVATFEATVCPAASAVPCPDAGSPPGCAILLSTVEGTLDLPGGNARIHIEGGAVDFPVEVKDTLFGSSVTCLFDMSFSGDAIIDFTVDGSMTITAVEDPVFEDVEVEITDADGGLTCDFLMAQQDSFKEDIIQQIEAAARSIIADVRARLLGMMLCEP